MIKTKQNVPFQRSLTQKPATVGQTYGERRGQPADAPPVTQSAPKPLDKFSRSTQKNPGTKSLFDANALYKSARRLASSAPYKRPLHDHIEKGTAPRAEVKKPSDQAILRFLNGVIEQSPPTSAPKIQPQRAAVQSRKIGS